MLSPETRARIGTSVNRLTGFNVHRTHCAGMVRRVPLVHMGNLSQAASMPSTSNAHMFSKGFEMHVMGWDLCFSL